MTLTRDEFLAVDDQAIKEVTVPESVPAWGGKTAFIRALTRGQQDEYLKRQMGEARVRADRKNSSSEVTMASMFGHDAWICVRGICDAQGKAIFTDKDIPALNAKSGEAIGWLAQQIVEFSGMGADVSVEQEAKN